jgi:hypothetical protein
MSGDHKLSIRVEAFTPRVSNTLRGFVTVVVPELHMKINDITVHQKNESRWIGLPGRAQVGRDGQVRKDERGNSSTRKPAKPSAIASSRRCSRTRHRPSTRRWQRDARPRRAPEPR